MTNPFILELKYCELCGALWFRTPESDAQYCPRCSAWVRAELPGRAHKEDA